MKFEDYRPEFGHRLQTENYRPEIGNRLENSQDKQAGKEQGIKSWRQDQGESWTRNLKEKRWEIKEQRKTTEQGLEPENCWTRAGARKIYCLLKEHPQHIYSTGEIYTTPTATASTAW